jgi:hypothetical protein
MQYLAVRLYTLTLSSAFLLISCGGSSPGVSHVAAAAGPEDPSDIVPHDRKADDVARFIAGLPGRSGSPFAELEDTEAWKEHRQLLDEAWSKADAQMVAGFRDFQKAELSDASLRAAHVFYPFSGPDTLTPTLFFPDSPTYVMVALEPAGTLPTVGKLEKKNLDKYLAETRTTVASELGRSFFITRQMDRQFRGQVTDGLTLPILHLLVRTHHEILGYRYVRLDDNGKVIDREPTYKAPGRIGNKGFEVEFKDDAAQTTHKLFYFSVNLSNERLKEDAAFITYMGTLKGSTTMLKATSYMTHKGTFSMIRDQILAISGAVLQDDSGIPFHYFQSADWKVQLYGAYTRPYGSFKWLAQPDLKKAFDEGAKPLPIRIGYGYSKVESNLLLARRG